MVVDTSALLAIALREPAAAMCRAALSNAPMIVISAGTLTECRVVALGKGVSESIEALLGAIELEIVPVTAVTTEKVREAYERWGKGFHAAKLNIFDCFAYAVATDRDLPLLYVGNDFAQTDVKSALEPPLPQS